MTSGRGGIGVVHSSWLYLTSWRSSMLLTMVTFWINSIEWEHVTVYCAATAIFPFCGADANWSWLVMRLSTLGPYYEGAAGFIFSLLLFNIYRKLVGKIIHHHVKCHQYGKVNKASGILSWYLESVRFEWGTIGFNWILATLSSLGFGSLLNRRLYYLW